jgi:hypothetical protein
VIITDLAGRTLIKCRYSERINVTSLPAGIYFVIINNAGKTTGTARLVISR